MPTTQTTQAPPTPAGDLFTFQTVTEDSVSVPAARVVQLSADGRDGITRVQLTAPHDVRFADAPLDELQAQLARLRGQGAAGGTGQGGASADRNHAQYRTGSAGTSGPAADPIREAWEQNLNGVREEFKGDFAAFRAFSHAQQAGRVHVVGQAEAPTTTPPAELAGTDAELRARFANDPKLRAEFKTAEAFIGYAHAVQAGRVNV